MNRPNIALALSGGSGRAIAHIGVLEVFKENNIPIDCITACSSGTIVAASFACGTMDELKRDWLSLDTNFLLSMLDLNTKGSSVLGTDKIVKWSQKFMLGKKFEDVEPRLGFVCSDLKTGESVLLSLGDMGKAARASCAVPGLFEPVEWGNKLLADGGLFSIVPVKEARDMGADMVIGVDIAATRLVIRKRYLHVWRGYNFLKKSLLGQFARMPFQAFNWLYEKTFSVVFYNQSDFFEKDLQRDENAFTVLARAMELIVDKQKRGLITLPTCDLMLSPRVKHLGKISFENSKRMLLEGRRAALEAIPEIRKMISDFDRRKEMHA